MTKLTSCLVSITAAFSALIVAIGTPRAQKLIGSTVSGEYSVYDGPCDSPILIGKHSITSGSINATDHLWGLSVNFRFTMPPQKASGRHDGTATYLLRFAVSGGETIEVSKYDISNLYKPGCHSDVYAMTPTGCFGGGGGSSYYLDAKPWNGPTKLAAGTHELKIETRNQAGRKQDLFVNRVPFDCGSLQLVKLEEMNTQQFFVQIWHTKPQRGSLLTYGEYCLGPQGYIPVIRPSGSPLLGGKYSIDLTCYNCAPAGGKLFIFRIAASRADIPLDSLGMVGCKILAWPSLLDLAGTTDVNGRASVQLPIPNAPDLLGAKVTYQYFPAFPRWNWFGGFVASAGAELTIGNY